MRGNQLTYEFCAAHGVAHRKTGKLVVASLPSESGSARGLMKNGETNGVEHMQIIDRPAIRVHEPHVEGFRAIEIPSTGIVASEDLVKAYGRVATDHGANIVVHAKVERLEPSRDGVRINSTAGEIETRCLETAPGCLPMKWPACSARRWRHIEFIRCAGNIVSLCVQGKIGFTVSSILCLIRKV